MAQQGGFEPSRPIRNAGRVSPRFPACAVGWKRAIWAKFPYLKKRVWPSAAKEPYLPTLICLGCMSPSDRPLGSCSCGTVLTVSTMTCFENDHAPHPPAMCDAQRPRGGGPSGAPRAAPRCPEVRVVRRAAQPGVSGPSGRGGDGAVRGASPPRGRSSGGAVRGERPLGPRRGWRSPEVRPHLGHRTPPRGAPRAWETPEFGAWCDRNTIRDVLTTCFHLKDRKPFFISFILGIDIR